MLLLTVFTAAHFFLGGRQHFSFSHRRYKFMLFFQQRNGSLSLALHLRRSFSSRTSLFLCLSLSLFSKFVDVRINLNLILQTTRIQKQFPLSVFVFIDSLLVFASIHKTRVVMRFPTKITSSCIWAVPYLLIELFYICMPVVQTDSGQRTDGHMITKILWDGQITTFSQVGGYACSRFARAWSFAKTKP